jgi:hypothetical protein
MMGLMVIGGILIILLVTALVSLLEGVVLTLLNWDSFGTCIRISLLINLFPTILGLIFIAVVPLGWQGIGVAFFFSILVDGALLARLKPGLLLKNYFNSILINLVSYGIIIAPAYLMR